MASCRAAKVEPARSILLPTLFPNAMDHPSLPDLGDKIGWNTRFRTRYPQMGNRSCASHGLAARERHPAELPRARGELGGSRRHAVTARQVAPPTLTERLNRAP